MSAVRSQDGTTIAYERQGQGPAVILVDGALCYRGMGPSQAIARQLAQRFTVYTYDRRGRGESDDAAEYATARELEDIEALLGEAGGSACVWGISSGSMLALEAARRLPVIRRLVLYEAPLVVDDSRPPIAPAWAGIRQAVAAGHRGDAVGQFLRQVGVPGPFVALMHLLPAWRKLTGMAHTLPYDGAMLEEHQRGEPLPAGRWEGVTVPTLVLAGGKSPAWMRNGSEALAQAIPNARFEILPGQTHVVSAKVVAPVLTSFFEGREAQAA